MKKIFFYSIFILAIQCSAFAGEKNIIIKFKSNTPSDILNNFKNNSARSGTSSVAKLSRDINIKSTKVLFDAERLNLNNDDYGRIGLDRIFIARIDDSEIKNAISLGSKNEYIEYIQTNGVLKAENIALNPNDPYYNSQYYLNIIGMPNAWDITLGDSNIVIGVIDTGMDFLHPDLQNSFKINYGEYGNGKESNGIDDDHNGFVDDWRGWDFTDEPLTGDPRRGDYLDPDNDPTDDNKQSHGTAAIGIINAAINNNTGIASVAPGCKVLVMRAFDSEGFGEEDDVANAILYGVSRGVRIFNCSFGDYIFSNLLRDVIRFAYTRNAFIVCSAGNDGSNRLHYPSAYDEVISVGASDNTDAKASFSSFGETVDIFAPGFQNLTTVRVGKGSSTYNGNYDKLNGTSFAAPVVSAVAGLILSRNPLLTNEELRGILVSTTTYLAGQGEWNSFYASGRINAASALENFNNPSIARIFTPFQDYTFDKDTLPICISAASPIFQSYSLYYRVGQNFPVGWIPIVENQPAQVLEDTVLNWNTSGFADTSYSLRLAIKSNSGRTIEHRMVIFKDKDPPVITDINFGNLIDKNTYSELILFATNTRTLGKIYYKRKNVSEPYNFILADVGIPNVGFIADAHFGLLSGNDLAPDTEYEFYVEATSLNGKSAVVNDTSFYFYTQPQINNYGFNQKNFTLGYSQSCNTIFDLNGNGSKDIMLNGIKNNLRLNFYEFNNGSFSKFTNDNWGDFKVGRDIADIDGDGRMDLLLSKGRNGFLYESNSPGDLPLNLIWSDSANENFWSSRIADTDGDGKKEILGLGTTGLRILESSGNNSFSQIANLNYFGTDSTPNSQNVLVEDFDGDGKKEVAFINLYYENASSTLPKICLSVYENISDNNFTRVFLDTIDRITKGDNIIAGDFNGDGKKDFAIGVTSKDGDLIQYYSLIAYTSTADNAYTLLDISDIYNYKSYTETSTKAADIDNDGKDEVLINTGTLYYILQYNNQLQRFTPVYYRQGINTLNQIVYDFDGNGINEIGLNTVDDSLFFFEKDIAFTGPATPLGLKGHSADSNAVSLSFESVPGADYYKIYRGDSTANIAVYDSTANIQYSDANVTNRKNYVYKVSAVDLQNAVRESQLTSEVKIYVHNKSRLLSAVYEGNGFLSLKFSERVSSTVPLLNIFKIDNSITPKNVAVKNNFEYFLTFDSLLQNGNHFVKTVGLTDFYNSPVDSNTAGFAVNEFDSAKFYISKVELTGSRRLRVIFNLNVDVPSASNTANYKFEPFDIGVKSVEPDNSSGNIVYVNLNDNGAIGATGKNYLLRASNIYSQSGIKIVDGAGSSFGLIFNKENLDEMYVYPNPYSLRSNQDYVTLANITRDASIDIFDLSGKFLINIKETNGNGGVEWNLKDRDGNKVPTGIYIYRATGKNSSGQDVEEKIGKFAVVK